MSIGPPSGVQEYAFAIDVAPYLIVAENGVDEIAEATVGLGERIDDSMLRPMECIPLGVMDFDAYAP